jgi:hypothetical protein
MDGRVRDGKRKMRVAMGGKRAKVQQPQTALRADDERGDTPAVGLFVWEERQVSARWGDEGHTQQPDSDGHVFMYHVVFLMDCFLVAFLFLSFGFLVVLWSCLGVRGKEREMGWKERGRGMPGTADGTDHGAKWGVGRRWTTDIPGLHDGFLFFCNV